MSQRGVINQLKASIYVASDRILDATEASACYRHISTLHWHSIYGILLTVVIYVLFPALHIMLLGTNNYK